MTTRHVLLNTLAIASFVLAGVLRSWFDVNPYIVTAVMFIGVVLGLWSGYLLLRGRGQRI